MKEKKGPEINFGEKTFCQTNFGPKKLWDGKNIGQKKILGSKKF